MIKIVLLAIPVMIIILFVLMLFKEKDKFSASYEDFEKPSRWL